jgi:uncharacterized protein (TIGR02231 family)
MLAALLLSALPCAAPAEDAPPVPVASRITEVIVHGDSARVRRSASVPGPGRWLFSGLPATLDAQALRARVTVGSVVGLEVEDRRVRHVTDAQLQEQRERLDAARGERRELDDRLDAAGIVRSHLERLLGQQERAFTDQVAAGKPDPAAWEQVLAFSSAQLLAVAAQARDAERQARDVDLRIADLEGQLGRLQAQLDVPVRDVIVETLLPGAATLDLEYLVGDCGWEPLYDLRTAADGTSVDLAYRAHVWQQTGEAWPGVDLVLSTAQPQRGAQGPDPVPVRLRLADDRYPAPGASAARGRQEDMEVVLGESLKTLGYAGSPADWAAVASVFPQGLSVQFRLPRKETVESRERPVTVLIGQQALPVALARVCVPALDLNVWVRGLTQNDTPWMMLPGRASVYFGQDYVGPAWFGEPVRVGQEFTLHLGADQGLKVERVKTDEYHETPGLFAKRQADTVGWRVRLENAGAQPARPDGAVEVLVREAIPMAADERIEAGASEESHAPLKDERWLKDLQEKGIHTWRLTVPRGGAVEVTFKVVTRWPENTRVQAGS